MNLIVLPVKKVSGLHYPLLNSIWKQDNGVDFHQTRPEMALQLLRDLKAQLLAPIKLWIAFDSYYNGKDFYLAVENLGFHWVTRAKSNATLYRKTIVRGKERFIAITPKTLFQEAKLVFSFWRKRNMCMAFKDIYLLVYEIHKGRGYCKEKIFKPLQAVVVAFQEEDPETGDRWSSEFFFRNAKQELD